MVAKEVLKEENNSSEAHAEEEFVIDDVDDLTAGLTSTDEN
jgi:hypothetical protein